MQNRRWVYTWRPSDKSPKNLEYEAGFKPSQNLPYASWAGFQRPDKRLLLALDGNMTLVGVDGNRLLIMTSSRTNRGQHFTHLGFVNWRSRGEGSVGTLLWQPGAHTFVAFDRVKKVVMLSGVKGLETFRLGKDHREAKRIDPAAGASQRPGLTAWLNDGRRYVSVDGEELDLRSGKRSSFGIAPKKIEERVYVGDKLYLTIRSAGSAVPKLYGWDRKRRKLDLVGEFYIVATSRNGKFLLVQDAKSPLDQPEFFWVKTNLAARS